jgi:two-component system, OmpR family, phosphate regulon sensor histidine kinase PhoR
MLDENASRNSCGTGLGLSISKKFIEKMGGSVKVESKLGQGSTFIV